MILVCVAAGAASPPAKGLGFAGQFSLSLAGHALIRSERPAIFPNSPSKKRSPEGDL